MSNLAIVILNYNGKHFLERFLPSVVKHSEGHDVYIADNSSGDDSIEFVRKSFPEVKLILLDKNYGFCEGYNRSLQQINSNFYLLLNSDVEVTKHWIGPLLRLFEHDPQIAVVQPKILSFNHKDQFEYAGAAGGFIDKFGYPFCRGRIFDDLETDSGQYDSVEEIFWATGACMLVRADVFHKMGGLDKLFFAHMEEIDLCWRLKNAGFKVMYCPESKVYHVGGGTLPKNNPKKVFFNHRNSLFMLVKNLPSGQLFYKLFIRMALDFPAAFFYALKGYPMNFFMVIKAHFHLYYYFFHYLLLRKNNSTSLKKMKGYYSKSIIWKYYMEKIKVFSKL